MTTLLQKEGGKAWKNKKSSETRKKNTLQLLISSKEMSFPIWKVERGYPSGNRLGSALNSSLGASMNLRHDSAGNSSLISSFPQSWCVPLAAPAPGRGVWGGSDLLCSAQGMVRGSSIILGLWLHQAMAQGLQEFFSACFPLHPSDAQHVRKRTLSY